MPREPKAYLHDMRQAASLIAEFTIRPSGPQPRVPGTAGRGSTPAAPSSSLPPWTARSPGGASRLSATGQGDGRRPSLTRRPGRLRPPRLRDPWRVRRGWTTIASCAAEQVAPTRSLIRFEPFTSRDGLLRQAVRHGGRIRWDRAPDRSGLALAGLVEVDRIGRVDRVRLAPDAPVRAWAPGPRQVSAVDVVSRWCVAVGAVTVLAATEDAPAAVAAIERRVSADALRPAIVAAELPMPDLTVLGEAFAREYERWAGLLARSIARDR